MLYFIYLVLYFIYLVSTMLYHIVYHMRPFHSLHRYMPSTLVALDPLATLLAAYRLTLALQLGRQVRSIINLVCYL